MQQMDCQIRYRDWLKEWLLEKDGFVKETTYASYSMAVINHIIPALGDCLICELTEKKLQDTVLRWLDSGRLDHKGGLSEKTVRDMVMLIRLSLRDAARRLDFPLPEMEIRLPRKAAVYKLSVMEMEEQRMLTQAILMDLNPRSAGILLSLHTGMRIGELCALTWEDIDMDKRIIFVRKTLGRIFVKELDGTSRTEVVISTPKTKKSVREIPISSFMMPVLRKIYQGDPSAYVITGTEDYCEPRAFRKYYESFLKRNQLTYVKFHGLRHTFATRCIEAGADCKTVSELLGHTSVNTTLNLYVHPQMDQKRKCVELAQYL